MKEQSRSSYGQIYAVVRQIPWGQVATYGQVARLADRPGQARLVGYALFRVTQQDDVPWHRVINAKGEVSQSPFRQGTDDLQRSLLEQEGIVFNARGKVNLHRYGWKPERVEEGGHRNSLSLPQDFSLPDCPH